MRRAPLRRKTRRQSSTARLLGRHAQRDEQHFPHTRDSKFQADDDMPRRQREMAEAFRDQPRHVIEATRPRPSARPLEVTIHAYVIRLSGRPARVSRRATIGFSRMPTRKTITTDTMLALGRAMPGVEVSPMYGEPALKLGGEMFAHRSARSIGRPPRSRRPIPGHLTAGGFYLRNSIPDTSQNVWGLLAAGNTPPVSFVKRPGRDFGGVVSPDGHWLAYLSEDTGGLEAYVQPFPQPGPNVEVTTAGTVRIWWRRDGRQLIALSRDLHQLVAADVESRPTFHAGVPHVMATLPNGIVDIDATPNRQRSLRSYRRTRRLSAP